MRSVPALPMQPRAVMPLRPSPVARRLPRASRNHLTMEAQPCRSISVPADICGCRHGMWVTASARRWSTGLPILAKGPFDGVIRSGYPNPHSTIQHGNCSKPYRLGSIRERLS